MSMVAERVQVLVVDDHPQTLAAMKALLEGPDREIVTATSGEEALRYLLHGEYAVVLLDVKMTGIDGYETAALIRAREKTRQIPIVFLTSNNKEAEHVVKGYSQGAVDYIFKPVMPEILLSKVNVFVELANKTLALRRQNQELERAKKELAARADELARSNADLEQFAYAASHDLKEPLRIVSSYVKLLATRYKNQLDSDANDFIDFAVWGVNRMERLIHEVLTYSRVGDTREFQPVEFAKILESALARVQVAVRESNAVVTHDSLPTVIGNEGELIRVVQNLIANAIKFRGPHTPEVHILAERRAPSSTTRPREVTGMAGSEEWLFSVRDNGIGIDPQYWNKIFILFRRLHNQADYDGSGVGLAMCKKIIEAHHGRIWVQSQPGEGSTFYFTLPVADPD